MIVFNRLSGKAIALNPDLIERVEATPDTVITLTTDTKFLVSESVEQVLQLITDYRAYVLVRARDLEVVDEPRPTLHVVPNELATARGAGPRSNTEVEFVEDDPVIDFLTFPHESKDD